MLIIALIVCVLLVLIVLIQNPKGGGLSSNFSASSQMLGVQKTGDFLEKGTWFLAIFLMVLSMAINVAVKGGADKTDNSAVKSQAEKAAKPTAQPSNSAPLNFPAKPAPAAPNKAK